MADVPRNSVELPIIWSMGHPQLGPVVSRGRPRLELLDINLSCKKQE